MNIGKVIAGFGTNNSIKTINVFNSNGTIDNSAHIILTRAGSVKDFAQQPDGKILVDRICPYINGIQRQSAARLNLDGSLDSSFNPDPLVSLTLNAVTLQSDSKIIVRGCPTVSVANIGRLNPDGTLDSSFILPGVINGENTNGKILVGGGFTKVSGVSHISILTAVRFYD